MQRWRGAKDELEETTQRGKGAKHLEGVLPKYLERELFSTRSGSRAKILQIYRRIAAFPDAAVWDKPHSIIWQQP